MLRGDHTKMDASDRTAQPVGDNGSSILQDAVDFKRYRPVGDEWVEIRGPKDLIEGEYLDIPHDPYYPEKIFASKYNGREILAGGCYLTNGTGGAERAYLIRYRDGVWYDVKSLVPDQAGGRLIVWSIDWDGEKWWVCGRRSEVGDGMLFTIDENDNVVDLSANVTNSRCMRAVRTNGKTTLVGGETVSGSGVRILWKIEGDTFTDITADMPDPGNANDVRAIDYSKGIWMVGGEGDQSITNRAWLHQWDGTTWTDLSSNLPEGGAYPDWRGNLGCISHSDKYWAIGIGNYSTLVIYDGTTWTTYDDELPGPGEGNPINSIVWTGYNWLLSYQIANGSGFALWDETAFYDISGTLPTDLGHAGLRYVAVYAEGCYFTFPYYDSNLTRCVQLGKRCCSPWIANKYRGPIDVETVKADMGRIGALRVDNLFKMPTINISGGPDWTGVDGEGPYANLDDNKIYWFSNSAWRSAP